MKTSNSENPKIKGLQSICFSLEQLQLKVDNHMKEGGWIYAERYRGWIDKYNEIVKDYNNKPLA